MHSSPDMPRSQRGQKNVRKDGYVPCLLYLRGISVRLRPIAALSIAALSALLLAGCSGSADDAASPTATVAADLCSAAAKPGDASDSIKAEGEVGEKPTVTFSSPIDTGATERTVLVEGDGDKLAAGDFAEYAFTVLDGSTGEELSSGGYEAGEVLPEQISPESGGQLFGCATLGSRIAVTATTGDDATPAVVYVIDLLSVMPTEAWGEEQPPVDGMPAVTLADDGTPSIEIPAGDPPTDLQISVLKKGDGPVVAAGDTTMLQYMGVRWDTGESFDSSWSKGAPIYIQGNTYVPGFVSALEGQTVGSQVLVVIPPALGYGAEPSEDNELAGQTLVFVIDILATSHAAPAAQ